MYMEKDLIEEKLYQTIDHSMKGHLQFYSVHLNKIHSFYEGNVRTLNILFAKDDEIMKLINDPENLKTNNIN